MAYNWRKTFFPVASDLFAPHLHMKMLSDSAVTVVPVANVTERNALLGNATPDNPLVVLRADASPAPRIEWSDGGRWHVTADTIIGRARLASAVTVEGTPDWTTIATVTATSLGGPCVARAAVTLANGNSGAIRTGSFRVTVDGVALTTPAGVDLHLPYVAGLTPPGQGGAFEWESQPPAGQRVWRLQANGSVDGAAIAQHGVLTVVERP